MNITPQQLERTNTFFSTPVMMADSQEWLIADLSMLPTHRQYNGYRWVDCLTCEHERLVVRAQEVLQLAYTPYREYQSDFDCVCEFVVDVIALNYSVDADLLSDFSVLDSVCVPRAIVTATAGLLTAQINETRHLNN